MRQSLRLRRLVAACAAWAVCLSWLTPCLAQPPAAERVKVRIDDATQQVIDGALTYLAARQTANGAWVETGEEGRYPVAITSYVLMAYLAAGHVPDEGKHGAAVARGVRYLVNQISDDGLFADKNSGQYMYEHGIATVVLAEVYGQSRDAQIMDRLERLVRVIVSSQNAEGGWRYRPIVQDADVSVTVLQLVALRAARNGGLSVPTHTIDAAVNYVRRCYVPAAGGFSYQPNDEPGFARTAAAIYSLQVCGLYDDPLVKQGSDYLFRNLQPGDEWFTYGSFYAAPAQYMIGDETWERWYGQMKGILLADARHNGTQASWDKRLDPSSPGPTYSTAVYTMILAMPNNYIPLYQR